MDPERLINGPQVATLRLANGLSVRALARLTGVSATVIRGLEEGRNHRALSVGFVADLACALGTTVAALVTPPGAEAAVHGSDADTLLAAVAFRGASIAADELATALEWEMPRVQEAARSVKRELQRRGVQLVDAGWNRLRLVPNDALLSNPAQKRLASLVTRKELAVSAMQVLAAVAHYQVDSAALRHATELERFQLASLLKQGLVIIEDGDRVRLAPETRFSLGMDLDGDPWA